MINIPVPLINLMGLRSGLMSSFSEVFFLMFIAGIPKNIPMRHPKSSKYLLSRCLEPLKTFSGDVSEFKHLLTRYLDV